VIMPKVEEVATPVAGATTAAAEPEVAKKGKKDEAADAAAPAKDAGKAEKKK
jgi:hypothetical protein